MVLIKMPFSLSGTRYGGGTRKPCCAGMGVKGKYLEVCAEKLLKYLEAEKSTHFLTEILTFPAGVKHQVTYGTHPSWGFASHHPPTNLWGLADAQPETTGAFGHNCPHSYSTTR